MIRRQQREGGRERNAFYRRAIRQARELTARFDGRIPLVVSPYDAELFGHWWYEGPQFLDFFYRQLHWNQSEIQAISPGDLLDSGMPIQIMQPSASSWGENGYFQVWINEKNSWMYPYQHDVERRMTEYADKFANLRDTGQYVPSDGGGPLSSELIARLLNQMARELLLAESSDWAFQIYKGTTVEYSTRRFQSHVQRFDILAKMLESGNVESEMLTEIERRDNIFSEIDYSVYEQQHARLELSAAT